MLATAVALLASADAFSLTAREIIDRSDRAMRGDTQMASYTITIKTRKWTRTMKMNAWSVTKEKKSFSEIIAPKKDEGNRFLLIDRNMWHFNPRIQKAIKLSPSMMLESWMGSDFTNDDIVRESSIVEDYDHILLGKERVDGHDCHVVQLNPRPDAAVVWGKIVYYARVADCLPVRQEYYNEHNVKKKEMTCGEFRTMHDRVIPTRFVMVTVGNRDRFTEMIIDDIRCNHAISPGVFSKQNLQRR
jgi:outer membrane lipoprotein-sorting protein